MGEIAHYLTTGRRLPSPDRQNPALGCQTFAESAFLLDSRICDNRQLRLVQPGSNAFSSIVQQRMLQPLTAIALFKRIRQNRSLWRMTSPVERNDLLSQRLLTIK